MSGGGGRSLCRLRCAPRGSPPWGKEAGMPFRPGVQPLASPGMACASQSCPSCGTPGVNSGDWRWPADKHGYVFSLVLGKAVPSNERFHHDSKFPFQLNVFKCKNLAKIKRSDG